MARDHAVQIPVLVDAVVRGQPRKLVLFANRNAFYYVLDRRTGEFLAADQGRVFRQVASDGIRRLARVLAEDPQLPLAP